MWKVRFQTNRAFWRLGLVTRMSCEFESRANYPARLEVLFYSTIAGVTLQLPLHASHMCHSSNSPVTRPFLSAHIWVFFTLSHTLPLHNSHLNIGYLIAKLQANLVRNKTNTWLNKFNLTNTKLKCNKLNIVVAKRSLNESRKRIPLKNSQRNISFLVYWKLI